VKQSLYNNCFDVVFDYLIVVVPVWVSVNISVVKFHAVLALCGFIHICEIYKPFLRWLKTIFEI
jgi:hypothetical protein